MNLASRKYSLTEQLYNIDEIVLLKLEFLLKSSKEDWFEELSVAEKEEIKLGLQDANDNKLISNEQVMTNFLKWKKN